MTDGERIAALEVKVQHLSDKLDEALRTVTELRDLLLKARGATALLSILLALASVVLGGIGWKIASWLWALPR